MNWTLLCLSAALSAALITSTAFADAIDDEMYCRFFQEGIVGDSQHVTQVTGIDGSYWYSDSQYDNYLYCGAQWHCVVLHFRPSTGELVEMSGTLGFEPGTPYWECEQPVVIAPD